MLQLSSIGTASSSLMRALQQHPLVHAGLLLAEVLHVAGHLKVLCCVGTPYSAEFFYSRGAYFVSDAATTLLSLLSLLPPGGAMGHILGSTGSILTPGTLFQRMHGVGWVGPMAALVAGHQVQHALYISCWHKGPQTYARLFLFF